MKFHNVIEVSIDDLKEDSTNPNELTQMQEEALSQSMDRFGLVYPVCYDSKTKIIADGEHRLRKLREKGVTKVMAIPLDFKDDSERRLFRQTMNKLHGTHEKYKDALELKILFDNNKLDDLALLVAGNKEEYIMLLEKKELIPPQSHEDNFLLPREAKYKIQRGEIWQLGRHRLMCGDATIKEDVDKLMDGKKVDLLLTDPPYGINVAHQVMRDTHHLGFKVNVGKPGLVHPRIYHHGIQGDEKPFNPEYLMRYGNRKIIFGANNFASKLSDNSFWIVWDKKIGVASDNNNFADVELAWTNINRKDCRIYRYLWSGLLRAGDRRTELRDRVHPTQKPVGMLSMVINDYSDENQIILDLYAGSGSTLIACEQTNRTCYMMEIDAYYCSVIIERWEMFTGRKATQFG